MIGYSATETSYTRPLCLSYFIKVQSWVLLVGYNHILPTIVWAMKDIFAIFSLCLGIPGIFSEPRQNSIWAGEAYPLPSLHY